ncbi:MAG: heme ABC exporter ATP-binding protein CcmA [Actinomycetota bacterium]|nr:heme ABC exporter ATP-binding protein CcmA [Actinomycetota bacterium]
MDDVVRLRSAVCLLGRFPALAGVDLVVPKGETLLVRGANGAGKTTLLRALAGLVPVVGGEALVLGCDLRRDRRAVRRRVGLLGHSAALYDDLTVADNLRFWSRAARSPTPDLAGAMARLGLDGRLAGVPAARLSAGQRRRSALAVLVARSPELWLLDEPHAGLDAAGRDVLDDLVRQVTAAGATVVLASHELDRAAALATRSVTVAGGRMVDDGACVSDIVEGPSQPEPVHVA